MIISKIMGKIILLIEKNRKENLSILLGVERVGEAVELKGIYP